MVQYIICFIIAFVLLLLSWVFRKSKLHLLFIFLSIIVLSFLAGARNMTIGTDLMGYGKEIFNICVSKGCQTTIDYGYHVETGYLILNYIVSLFTNKIYVFLFIVQFIIMFFSIFGIKKLFKDNYPIAVLLFLLFFYNTSLNIIRQSIAISICIYSLHFLFEDKWKLFILFVGIAYFFHSSALIFLLALVIKKTIDKDEKNFKKMIFYFIVFCIFLLLFFDTFFDLITDISIFSKYKFYYTHYVSDKFNLNLAEILIDTVLILFYFLFRKKYDKYDKLSQTYCIFLFIDLIAKIIGAKFTIFFRLGMYFNLITWIYFLSNINVIFRDDCNRRVRMFSNIIAIVLAFAYYYLVFAYGGSGHTIPYDYNYLIPKTGIWGLFRK